jgi:hypothetical protein
VPINSNTKVASIMDAEITAMQRKIDELGGTARTGSGRAWRFFGC